LQNRGGVLRGDIFFILVRKPPAEKNTDPENAEEREHLFLTTQAFFLN
jgi:hypothetical protein